MLSSRGRSTESTVTLMGYVLDLSIGDYEQCVKVCKNMAVGGELKNHIFVQQTTKLPEHIKVIHGR